VREVHLRTSGPAETKKVAATIAGALRPGDVVALTGELGAGKTCFVQGAASALGVTERVTSPSFVLRREYAGTIPLVHLDVYRLDMLSEVVDLGFEEIFDRGFITFIEWGDAMSPLLPSDHLEVELRLGEVTAEDATVRDLVVRPRGPDWLRRLPGLTADLQRWTHPRHPAGAFDQA